MEVSISDFSYFSLCQWFKYCCIYFAHYFYCTLPVQKLDANEIWLSFYLCSAYTYPVAKKLPFFETLEKIGFVYHRGL